MQRREKRGKREEVGCGAEKISLPLHLKEENAGKRGKKRKEERRERGI